jgi:hypothetical protein
MIADGRQRRGLYGLDDCLGYEFSICFIGNGQQLGKTSGCIRADIFIEKIL